MGCFYVAVCVSQVLGSVQQVVLLALAPSQARFERMTYTVLKGHFFRILESQGERKLNPGYLAHHMCLLPKGKVSTE